MRFSYPTERPESLRLCHIHDDKSQYFIVIEDLRARVLIEARKQRRERKCCMVAQQTGGTTCLGERGGNKLSVEAVGRAPVDLTMVKDSQVILTGLN